MHDLPFAGTWASWNGPEVQQELAKARDLGVNTIRIGIPFNHFDTVDVVWDDGKAMTKISPIMVNQMKQLLQIASVYGMKVIFVLFEWYDDYPAAGSRLDKTVVTYLQGLVGPFANDDRVLAWDLHNEPDNYGEWQGGHYDKVIKWLQHIYGLVRDLDKRHPITVGVGNDTSLWQAASDGTTLLSFVDFAAFHSYDAGAVSKDIADIKTHTDKPILLEEMGWPTSPGHKPNPPDVTYDENTQNYLYKTMLRASKTADIAGVVQWTLWDYKIGSTTTDSRGSFEEHFGLVRLDGSLKPAADIFKNDYTARLLPSDSKSNVPLTR